MDYVYAFFFAISFLAVFNFFVNIFLTKRKHGKLVLAAIEIIRLCFMMIISCIMFPDNVGVRQFSVILINTVYVVIVYRNKIISSFIFALIFQCFEDVIEYIGIVIIQLRFAYLASDLLRFSFIGYITGFLCLSITYTILFVFKNIRTVKYKNLLKDLKWAKYVWFPLFAIISILFLILSFDKIEDTRQGAVLLFIACGLLVMNIYMFEMIYDSLKRESELYELKIIEERGNNQRKLYTMMLDNINYQRKMMHEFKNHVICISALARDADVEGLNRYLEKINYVNLQYDNSIDTNHKLINVILNEKYAEAKEKGINFIVKINDLSNIKIEDQDLVVLISNLLNNAFESCEKCKDPVVKLKFMIEDSQTIIAISNKYQIEPVVVNGEYMTSKKSDAEMHGIGIKSIIEIVKKYDGMYAIKCEDNWFKFSILFS